MGHFLGFLQFITSLASSSLNTQCKVQSRPPTAAALITASSGTNNTGVNCTYYGQDVRDNLTLASTHTLKFRAYLVEPTLDDHFKQFWELESLCVTKDEVSGYASNQV